MKKGLFMLACLALLGACSREDDAGGVENGVGQGLTLMLDGDSVGMEVTGGAVALFNLPGETGHGTRAEFFTGEGPVVLEEGGMDGGVVLAVAGVEEDEVGEALRNGGNGISVDLRLYPTTVEGSSAIASVFAGVLPVDETMESGTMRMERLAGGLMVEFTRGEDVVVNAITVKSPYYKPVELGGYELWLMLPSVGEVGLREGEVCYMWPLEGTVKGVVEVTRVSGTGEEVPEFYMFESAVEMEPNRVLYLTVELPGPAVGRSAGELTARVVKEELKEF